VQRYSLARGARVLAVETELDIEQSPPGDPWESYYAARFAWPDEAADLYRDVGLTTQPTDARRIEAPHFVELRSGRTRTAILSGGLPYHRRCGARMLDTLLVVAGETARRFRYGIGLDLPHPIQQALDLANPVVMVADAPRPAGASASNWLFHVDAKNVVATHWSTIRAGDKIVGFRARLLETAGLAGRVRLRALRDFEHARHVDFRGETLAELPTAGDCVTIDMAAFEWVEIEARLRG
jgi:alpha-mannosidase